MKSTFINILKEQNKITFNRRGYLQIRCTGLRRNDPISSPVLHQSNVSMYDGSSKNKLAPAVWSKEAILLCRIIG
jgi:hypothetical protein